MRHKHQFRKLPIIALLSSVMTLTASFATNNTVLIQINEITIVIKKSTSTIASTSEQKTYLDTINKARSVSQDCGEYGIKEAAPALTWNKKLAYSAYIHSNDLAQSDTFDHDGSGEDSDVVASLDHPGTGSTLRERIEYAGYTNWSAIGENIAAGQKTVQDVVDAWIKSPGHCSNIMNTALKEVGMSKVVNDSSTYKIYWTQDFGALQ